MNTFTFEDLYIGLSASFETTITQCMLKHFVLLSGDSSPLHTDEAFAKEKGYAGIVVHGMLTSTLYSQLVGLHLPGKNGYSQEYKLSFTAPVYVEDRLTVYGEIEYINKTFKQIWITAYIVNACGEKVSRATIKAGLF